MDGFKIELKKEPNTSRILNLQINQFQLFFWNVFVTYVCVAKVVNAGGIMHDLFDLQ